MPAFPAPDQAERNAMAALQAVLNAKTYRLYGFQSLEEARGNLEKGAAIAEMTVDAARLASFRGGELDELFVEDMRWIRPLRASGRTRSSIVYAGTGGEWRAVSSGHAETAQVLERERAVAAKKYGLAEKSLFLLTIPGLNLSFLGVARGRDLALLPLGDDPKGRYRRMELADGRRIFRALAADAEALPPLR
jgi:hypothetical protein